MEDAERNTLLLNEWISISKRIDSIDARIWQGAGILLVISIGGFSLIGRNPSNTWFDLSVVALAAVISIAVLIVWLQVFSRWIFIQGNLGYRAREIEDILDLRYNRYSRLIEYWDKTEGTKADLLNLKEHYNQDYINLEKFYRFQSKKKLGHTTIRAALRSLTYILIFLWVAVLIAHVSAFFLLDNSEIDKSTDNSTVYNLILSE